MHIWKMRFLYTMIFGAGPQGMAEGPGNDAEDVEA
jgi:hypothetical protein